MDANTFQPLYRAYQRSGLSIRAFCLDHGIPAHTFYYWRKRRVLSRSSAPSADFIEVHPWGMDAASSPLREAPASSASMKLVVGPATFHLSEGFSKQVLVLSLQALQEAKLC